MVKNSYTLPLFGLGLILSTSPIVLLDSSLIGNPIVTKSVGEEKIVPKIEGLSEESKEVLTIGNGDNLDSSNISTDSEEKAVNGEETTEETIVSGSDDKATEEKQTTNETTQSPEVTESTPIIEPTTPKAPEATTPKEPSPKEVTPTPEKSISSTISNTSEKDASKANTKSSPKSPKSASKNPSGASGSQKNSRSSEGAKVKGQGNGRDYISRRETTSRGVYIVTANNGSEHYVYSFDKDLTFALPKDHATYQKVNEENITVKLFVNPAWTSSSKTADEYKELTEEEKKEFLKLFSGKTSEEKKRLKQILFSLSNRREWKSHENTTNFTSTHEGVIAYATTAENNGRKNKKGNNTSLELKIKYFKEFSKFKEYLEKRLTECTAATTSGQCLATSSELEIIDQDKVSFFSDSRKKK